MMIGALVRRARVAKGLTQGELALQTGLRQTYISQVEGGEIRLPRDHNLDALGKALGISRQEFYAESGMLDDLDNGERESPELPAVLLEAWRNLVRKHPELGPQLDAARDDPDFAGQIIDLSTALGYVIRGFLDDVDRPGDGI